MKKNKWQNFITRIIVSNKSSEQILILLKSEFD